MSKFDFKKFDSLCEQTLGNYSNVFIPIPEQMPSSEQELTDDALRSAANWVTSRVLADLDLLLETG